MIALAPLTVAADSQSDVEALKRGLRVFPSGVVALCTTLDDGNQHAVHQTDRAAGMPIVAAARRIPSGSSRDPLPGSNSLLGSIDRRLVTVSCR